MTDEELESIPLLDCPSCDSHNTSVRRASQEWWLIGCLDCFNEYAKETNTERICDRIVMIALMG